MTTTSTAPTTADLQQGLRKLLSLATEKAALEAQIETLASELGAMELLDVLPRNHLDGVHAEVTSAIRNALGEHGHSDYTALQLCEDVQDAASS